MRAVVNNTVLFSSASCTGSWVSEPFNLTRVFGFGLTLVSTPETVGTASIQFSNDPGSDYMGWTKTRSDPIHVYNGSYPPLIDVHNWSTLTAPTTSVQEITAGSPSPLSYNVADQFARWGRVRFVTTATAPTGSITAYFNPKGL